MTKKDLVDFKEIDSEGGKTFEIKRTEKQDFILVALIAILFAFWFLLAGFFVLYSTENLMVSLLIPVLISLFMGPLIVMLFWEFFRNPKLTLKIANNNLFVSGYGKPQKIPLDEIKEIEFFVPTHAPGYLKNNGLCFIQLNTNRGELPLFPKEKNTDTLKALPEILENKNPEFMVSQISLKPRFVVYQDDAEKIGKALGKPIKFTQIHMEIGRSVPNVG